MDFAQFECKEYLESSLAAEGLWDETAQLFLLVSLHEVECLENGSFLAVGRPGVDDISFGYRRGRPGVWALYPMSGEFKFLAPTLAEFLHAWREGVLFV